MLTATGVRFGYGEGQPALKGVTVSIPGDGIVGILGPNGSGKTTLLRILAGTRHPQQGTVTLDGVPMARAPRAQLARRLAVVPQETELAFDYTVAEVAMMGRYAHLGAFEIEGPRDIAVVDEALASTGTRHLKERAFATLSGGEKQRVVIAAALAQIAPFRLKAETTESQESFRLKAETTGGAAGGFRRKAETTEGAAGGFRLKAETTEGAAGGFRLQAESRYLLLDEPTASLDLAYQLEVAALLRALHAERRAGIVISTHDISLAGTLCDTLILLRDGEIVAGGATDDVLTAENLRHVYGVETEISRHPSGQRIVVPLRRTAGAPR
jgi:heme transport system ATP-binding protein